MNVIKVLKYFSKLSLPAKMSVLFMFFVFLASTGRLLNQIQTFEIDPFGFLKEVTALRDIKANRINKGGQNIGLRMSGDDADFINNFEQSIGLQNGFRVNIVNSISDLNAAVSFITKSWDAGQLTFIRFCVNDGTRCEFPLNNQSIDENHAIIKFCTELGNLVPKASFVCSTGPNEPTVPVEYTQFGYSGGGPASDQILDDISSKSVQLAKILKSKGIQTSTYSIDIVRDNSSDLRAYIRRGDLSNVFDYVALNVYELPGFDAYQNFLTKQFSESGKQVNPRGFAEALGAKVLITEYGSLDNDRSKSFEVLKVNMKNFCQDELVSGVALFRSSKSLFGQGGKYAALFPNGPDEVSGGRRVWPHHWDDQELKQILSSCSDVVKFSTEAPEESFELITDAERCVVYNPITNTPYSENNDCSIYYGSKLGVNNGFVQLDKSELNIYRGKDPKLRRPNLNLGSVVVLAMDSGYTGAAAQAVVAANETGYFPIVRFCYNDQPGGCSLNYNINDSSSFAKVCETIYKLTEDAQARFVCVLGPNEPKIEWKSFPKIFTSGKLDYDVLVEGANSNARYLQKYRDRMFLAPAAFAGGACYEDPSANGGDAKNYLFAGKTIDPTLFDYILANIYTMENLEGYPDYDSSGNCNNPSNSIREYVKKHNLKFILTEFGKSGGSVSNSMFEKDLLRFCQDETVDYINFFRQLWFKSDIHRLESFQTAWWSTGLEAFNEYIRTSILTPEYVRDIAALCPKYQPTVDFYFNTIKYKEESSGINNSVSAFRIDSHNTKSNLTADIAMSCNPQVCRYLGYRTIRVNLGIKALASFVSNKYFNAVTIPAFNTMNIGYSVVEPQSKFSGSGSIESKQYPFPYLGSLLNQSNLLAFNFINFDPNITTLYVHPASLSDNFEKTINFEKSRNILQESSDKFFKGYDFEDPKTGKKMISNQNYIEARSNETANIVRMSNVMFNTDKNIYRQYDPLKFNIPKFLKLNGDNTLIYQLPDNYVTGPEIIVDEFYGDMPSIDVCWHYARRFLSGHQMMPGLKLYGVPDCKFMPERTFVENKVKKTCASVRQFVCNDAEIHAGLCRSREDYFRICIEMQGILEGKLYYNIDKFLKPDDFKIDGVMSALHKFYTVINRNLSNRGLRLNTGDYILAVDAQAFSSIRDNKLRTFNKNTSGTRYNVENDKELEYDFFDPLKPTEKTSLTGENFADLFKNDIPLTRPYEPLHLEYGIPFLGFIYPFTELLTIYTQNSHLSTIDLPKLPTKITNPFYKNPEICTRDEILCNSKNIIAPEVAELYLTIPLLTCDAYYLRNKYDSKEQLMNMLKTLNLPSNEYFENALDSIFKIPKKEKRFLCLESLDVRHNVGVLEQELCKRGFVVPGVCEAKCIDNKQPSNDDPVNQPSTNPATWSCSELKCKNLPARQGVQYPSCPTNISGFCDNANALNVMFGNGDANLLSDQSKTCEEKIRLIGQTVRQNLENITFLGSNVQVHKKVVEAFRKVENDIRLKTINGNSFNGNTYVFPSGSYTFISGGTFNPRPVRGFISSPNSSDCKISNHAFGIAIDLNPSTNQYQGNSCNLDIPPEVVEAFETNGFRWGGRYPLWSKFDPMHFEYCQSSVSNLSSAESSSEKSVISSTIGSNVKAVCPMPSEHKCFQGPSGWYSHCASDLNNSLPVDFYPAFKKNRDYKVIAPEDGKITKVVNYSSTSYGNLGRSIYLMGESGILYYFAHLSNDAVHKRIQQQLTNSSNGLSVKAGEHIGNLCTKGPDGSTDDAKGYCIYDFNNIHLHTSASIAGNQIDPYVLFGEILGCNLEAPASGLTARSVLPIDTKMCAAYSRDSSDKIVAALLNDLSCVDKKPKSSITKSMLDALIKKCNVANPTLRSECESLRNNALKGLDYELGQKDYHDSSKLLCVSESELNSEFVSTRIFGSFNELVYVVAQSIAAHYNNFYPPELLKATIRIETSLIDDNKQPYSGDPALRAWSKENAVGASGPAQFLSGVFMKAASSPAFDKCMKEIGIEKYTISSDLRNFLGPALCAAAVKHSEDIQLSNNFLPKSRDDWYAYRVSARDTRAVGWCKPYEKYPEKSSDKSDLCQKYDVLSTDKLNLIQLAGRRYLGACYPSLTLQLNNGFNYCDTLLEYATQYKSEFTNIKVTITSTNRTIVGSLGSTDGSGKNSDSSGGSSANSSTKVLSCTNYMLAPVTKTSGLPASYVPSNLVPTNLPGGGQLVSEAALALKNLFDRAKTQGIYMKVVSGYRSYSYQQTVFNNWVATERSKGLSQEEAEVKANTYSAKPGHSEHQLGTAVDVACATCNAFDNSAGNKAVYDFVEANAHQFGFIISYPRNSQNLTGYIYEPWHLRYVGIELANEIFNSGYLNGGVNPQDIIRSKGACL